MENWKLNDGSNMSRQSADKKENLFVEKVIKILDVSINFFNKLILHRPDLHNVHACKQNSIDVHALVNSRKKVLDMCMISWIL